MLHNNWWLPSRTFLSSSLSMAPELSRSKAEKASLLFSISFSVRIVYGSILFIVDELGFLYLKAISNKVVYFLWNYLCSQINSLRINAMSKVTKTLLAFKMLFQKPCKISSDLILKARELMQIVVQFSLPQFRVNVQTIGLANYRKFYYMKAILM